MQLGPFWLERLVGQGAHSEVFVAQGVPPHGRVALKVLSAHAAREPELVRRFAQEGDLLAGLRLPAIVRLHDRGATAGRPWLALELIQGPSLEDLLRARGLTLRRGVGILARLARAVDQLHRAGVVHRDLSPRNVLLPAADEARIIDFGLALRSDSPRSTTPGAILGSPDVLAPEQVAGGPDTVTPRADVYALGAILYRLLTGRVPHADAPAGAGLDAIASGRVPPPRSLVPSVPPALSSLCLAAMATTPTERPDAAELAAGLEAWLGAVPASAEDHHTTTLEGRAGVRPPASSSDPWVGTAVSGYRIERLLGRGGMGAVYLAKQEDVGRTVALKVVHAGRSARAARRFQREAQALGRLRHPNLVEVHAATAEGEWGFLAMSYIDGESLADLAARGPLPPFEAARIVRDAASGLAHAHARGVVHRDLKPANILLDREGTVRVVDFGVARLLDLDSADQRATMTGELVGTPAYAAPEQVTSDSASIGPHTDVFALGVILYELLTGRRPFEGENLAQLAASLIAGRSPLPSTLRPDVPRGLDAVCMQALSASPLDRQASAEVLAGQLDGVLAGEGAPPRRRGLRFLIVALCGCALLATVLGRPQTSDEVSATRIQEGASGAAPADPLLAPALRAIELGCAEDALELASSLSGDDRRALEASVGLELLETAAQAPPGELLRRRLLRGREELALALATGDAVAAGRALGALDGGVADGSSRMVGQLPAWRTWLRECADGRRGGRPDPSRAWRDLVELPADVGLAWDPATELEGALAALDREARTIEEVGGLKRALTLRADALASNPRAHELRFEHARALGMDRRPGEALIALALVTAGDPDRLGALTTRIVRLLQQNGWAAVQEAVEELRGPEADGARSLLWAYRVLLGPRLEGRGLGFDVGAPLPLEGDARAHEVVGSTLERFPAWFAMRGVRGLARARLGFRNAAARDFAAYVLAAKGGARAHIFVAGCLATSGDDAGAIEHLRLAAHSDAEEVVKWHDAWCFHSLVGRSKFEELAKPR